MCRKGRLVDVEPYHDVLRIPQGPHQGFAQVACASCNQDFHAQIDVAALLASQAPRRLLNIPCASRFQ